MDEQRPEVTIRQTFSKNLKRIRLAKGLSQEGLAELSGLHRTYVSSVERSERNISIDNIARLAKALNVSIGELVADYAVNDASC